MSAFRRYMAIQAVEWVLVSVVLYALHQWTDLPLWAALALFGANAAKDLALFPFLRRAYETDARTGIAQLVGVTGVVRQPLNPEGYIRIRGELWRARPENRSRHIPAGTKVRVRDFDGMTLLVSEHLEDNC